MSKRDVSIAGWAAAAALFSASLAQAAPVGLTSINCSTYYDVGSGGADVPSPAGTSNLALCFHNESSGSSTSQAAIAYDPLAYYNYSMQFRTAVNPASDTAEANASAWLNGVFFNDLVAPLAKLYFHFKLDGAAAADEGALTNYSQIESAIKVNGNTLQWLGSSAGLYNDNQANTGDIETIHVEDIYELALIPGNNTISINLESAYSYADPGSQTEGWLNAFFTFSTTRLTQPEGSVAEPGGIALTGLGLALMAGVIRRRRPT